jgi:serine protease Do
MFGSRPDETEEASNDAAPAPSKLGVNVRSLNQEQAERLGLSGNKGVIITEVKPDSFAEDIGLQPGDVVTQINRQPVNDEDEFRKLTGQLKSGQDVVFLVRRGRTNGGNVFLSGTLP